MSKWTHVAGIIRVDTIVALTGGNPRHDLLDVLGPVSTFHVPRDDTTLPYGSEGSLEYDIIRTGTDNSMSWGYVAIYGDLRDYTDHLEIIDWLEKTVNDIYAKGIWIRNVSMCIDVESNPTTYMVHWHTDMDEDNQGLIVTEYPKIRSD